VSETVSQNNASGPLVVLGIVGGVASGKSVVAAEFERLGAKRIDGDRLGHEVLQDPQVCQAVRLRWSDAVMDDEGRVNRAALARMVFAPRERDASGPNRGEPDFRDQAYSNLNCSKLNYSDLNYLEQITHPRIEERIRQQIAALRDELLGGAKKPNSETKHLVVLDAAVMLKAGWDDVCDFLAFVDAPQSVRLHRALARGWSESDFSAREEAQESVIHKRKLADFVIDASGSIAQTRKQVEQLYNSLVPAEQHG